jgi:hypothetical protein
LVFSDLTTYNIPAKPNGILSLSVTSAVTVLALTAVKIPQGVAGKGSLFFLSLKDGQHHHQTPMLISEKKERKTIGLVSPAVISVCLYDRSNILPADF